MSAPTHVVVEADGGSRGNPGPAAYGALLRDAGTGEVIAQHGETIGIATNNVAEYRGLVAGLELAAEHAPGARIEVRMDSQLVVEQMSGNWKIKHPDLKPLALQASRLAPPGTTYTWVPRAQNTAADLLVNEALDARPRPAEATPTRGWSPAGGPPTTLVLVRHGATAHTADKRFSGGLTGRNPALTDEGRDQVRATADWLAPLAGTVDAVISSPLRRTRETADILAARLDAPVSEEEAIAEIDFGSWEGLTFAEVQEQDPDELSTWLGDLEHAAGGGESFGAVALRVLAARDRIVTAHAGQTVVLVSHVTPIKVLVADALGAPLEALFRMELSPASVTVVSYFRGGPDGDRPMANLRL
ncbi:MAG TPA: histidine phosphatase family protein, partial [Marmoricola sp.]|nr:histidine phosphatase family protein [Marmoricola sp.]